MMVFEAKTEVALRVDVAWKDRAYCLGIPNDIFFAERGGSNALAKLICSLCEVRAECLDYAVELNNSFGVFGMTTPRNRRNIRMRRSDREEYL